VYKCQFYQVVESNLIIFPRIGMLSTSQQHNLLWGGMHRAAHLASRCTLLSPCHAVVGRVRHVPLFSPLSLPPVCKLDFLFCDFNETRQSCRPSSSRVDSHHSHAVLPRRSQIIKGKLTFSPASAGIAKCAIVVVNSKRVVLFILIHKY